MTDLVDVAGSQPPSLLEKIGEIGKPPVSDGISRFGHFQVLQSSRTLVCRGQVVDVGGRAFDLLVLLLTHQGKIVSKSAIMKHVWPTTTVDESNLRFQITCLRRALGEERDRIKTVTGRGYLFDPQDTKTALEGPHYRAARTPNIDYLDRMPAIVIIDEDPDNRAALHRLLQPIHAYVLSFGSVEAFHDSQAGGGGGPTSH
ncbi:winged helix-turn-helix domain-containing protein [Sphingomonas sp. PB4P5]|uniref:winged helix-turn-helix domain-containing protein n=1 Tax=Parasphingomonas puruogangriensis TaxID=3096155 RepID=UPI002FC836E5